MTKYKVVIKQDEDPISPREDAKGCCLGVMVTWHRRYQLGEKHNYADPGDFLCHWNNDNAVVLPVYLYDHSGITISTQPFSCRWDSGQLGYIYASHEAIKKEFGAVNAETLEKAKRVLLAEVDAYDQYIRGDIYCYEITKTTKCKECGEEKTEVVDSCGNFYGSDIKTNGMLENIPKKYHKVLKACGNL